LRLGKVLELQDDRVDVSDEDVMYKSHACGDFDGVFGDLVGLEMVMGDWGGDLLLRSLLRQELGETVRLPMVSSWRIIKCKSQKCVDIKDEVESKMVS
jgi:hypothetical protein